MFLHYLETERFVERESFDVVAAKGTSPAHEYKTAIAQWAGDDIARKLELLEAAVQRAKSDKEFAREFLQSVNA